MGRSLLLLGIAVLLPRAAGAAHVTSAWIQPEQRDANGRITVEAAAVQVVECDEAGENGGTFYVYQYLYRPGFRVIRPPEWGQAIGGQDWETYTEAVEAACTAEVEPERRIRTPAEG